MAYIESRSSMVLLCVVFFVIANSFCHCASLTRLKALGEFRESSMLSQGQAKASGLHHGRLLIGQTSLEDPNRKQTQAMKNLLDVYSNYQADMGNHLSPLPLSMLPPSCGYTVRSTQSSLILVAPYDGCFVALEEESYVLPLRWLGLPVRMSCPLKPSCVRIVYIVESVLGNNPLYSTVNGNWEPLMVASSSCGFSVVAHPEGVHLLLQDGMYTLELTGDGETKISCPSLAPVLPEPPKPQPELQSEISKPQATVPQLPGFPQKPAPFNPNPAEASKGPHVQLPEKPVPTKLPLSERPPGPIHSPLYPYNFYARFLPQGPYRMPKPTPQPASTTAPKGQLKQPLSPLRPGATKATPQPAAPQGPLYPYPLYYQPESQSLPAKKPVPKPDLQPPISPVTKSP
uniref:ZP domain-containing protein n=1 Tax=Mastacembelus armatus TaxID=205130 RepID=A0A7N8XVA3_9TELE